MCALRDRAHDLPTHCVVEVFSFDGKKGFGVLLFSYTFCKRPCPFQVKPPAITIAELTDGSVLGHLEANRDLGGIFIYINAVDTLVQKDEYADKTKEEQLEIIAKVCRRYCPGPFPGICEWPQAKLLVPGKILCNTFACCVCKKYTHKAILNTCSRLLATSQT